MLKTLQTITTPGQEAAPSLGAARNPQFVMISKSHSSNFAKKCASRERYILPLVFTTTGGTGPEATRFLKRVAEKLSAKTRERYSDLDNQQHQDKDLI